MLYFKLKKYFIPALILTVISCAVCIVCGCGGRKVLSAPQNLKVEAEVLSWDGVENAAGYAVDINGVEYETQTNELDIMDKTLGEELNGTDKDTVLYEIKVMALGDWEDFCDSVWSETYAHNQKFIKKFQLKSKITDNNGLFKEEVYELSSSNNFIGKMVVPEYYDNKRIRSVTCPKGCTSAYLPDTVTYASFNNCKKLEAVRLPENLYNGDLRPQLFVNCESLKRLNLPKRVRLLDGWTFAGCNSLTEITVDEENENFRSDGDMILSKSGDTLIYSLTNGVIPEGVVKIQSSAFYTRSYKKLYIPKSLTEADGLAFVASRFDEIEIDEENTVYKSVGGCVLRKSDNALVGALGNEKIPEEVSEIPDYVFSSEIQRKRVFIPSTVKRIGNRAFYESSHMSVTVPESVEEVGASALSGNIYLSENQNRQGWARPDENGNGKLWHDAVVACVFYNCKLKYDGAYPYVYALKYTAKTYDGLQGFVVPSLAAAPVRDGYTLLGFTTKEGGTTPEITLKNLENNSRSETIKLQTDSEYLYAVWQKN